MKSILNYKATKYKSTNYLKASKYIFEVNDIFVMSLIFEQEKNLGEGDSPINISQYPLEPSPS